MEKMNSLFGTSKKSVVAVICIIAILALLTGGTVMIVNAVADNASIGDESDFIGLENAKSIALTHAGFADSDVRFIKVKLDKENGYTVYEIDFFAAGMEYEYTINAKSGTIMEYDMDTKD